MDALLAAANELMMQFACNQIFQFTHAKASRFLQQLYLRRDAATDRASVFLEADGRTPSDRKWVYKPLKAGDAAGAAAAVSYTHLTLPTIYSV